MAERRGFEPLIGLPLYMISNHAPSTNSAISPWLIAQRLIIIHYFAFNCKRFL